MQAVEEELPVKSLYVPAAQAMQAVALVDGLYVPLWQRRHMLHAYSPELYLPHFA
jgi:hypothetical protein